MSWEEVKKIMDEAKQIRLGPHMNLQLNGHWSLLRTMARYKFVANLVRDKSVLDVGCGEGLGTWMLGKYCKVTGIDSDARAIDWANANYSDRASYELGDILRLKKTNFDVVTAIDVIEHIPQDQEERFMGSLCSTLNPHGFAIVGTPNIKMSQYESPEAKAGHINMYNHTRLEELVGKFFHHVFTFGMNDEVTYTGFKPMAQYLMTMGVNRR